LVFSTTNSWGIVPSLVTVNVSDPDTGVADGVTDHWFRLTEMFWPASADVEADDGDPAVAVFELEHAAVPTTSEASKPSISRIDPSSRSSLRSGGPKEHRPGR
jgi:hypothetical protein